MNVFTGFKAKDGTEVLVRTENIRALIKKGRSHTIDLIVDNEYRTIELSPSAYQNLLRFLKYKDGQ